MIGLMYIVTSFAFFLIGGLMALLMRMELTVPGMQFLSNEQYNQLFTMHGTIMLLLYATPVFFDSPTTSCHCRSGRRTCVSRDSTPSATGSISSAA